MLAFDPQPSKGELPERLASPFATGEPHPLAQRAARELQRVLGALAEGKMFGVLVVAASDGQVGVLRAFSGMLGGKWQAEGFAPPLFEVDRLEGFWPAGEKELAALEAQHRALVAEATPIAVARAKLIADHGAALAALHETHRENRKARHEARTGGGDAQALDQLSRADGAKRRWFDAEHRAALEAIEARLGPIEAKRLAVQAQRTERSNALLQHFQVGYVIDNARGERKGLRALFAPHEPPGGAGDCAAPKLLWQAHREGLRPLALAEFWWGARPPSGDRRPGAYYAACRSKCGVVLPFMLEGLNAEAAPVFGARGGEARVVFEDEWLVVVDKPAGLLSVAGRSALLQDSVASRLGGLSVHRLDLDTSGLLLVARDRVTHAAIQKQFALREIEKRYVAWLDGQVAGVEGRIELPLRVDLEDRPRQIHDPVHGKAAVTDWRVLERVGGRTRVVFFPRTGRTHQLRVHASHPLGLGAPIAGDRLYGREGERLLLHAEALTFTHPKTGARMTLESPAPF